MVRISTLFLLATFLIGNLTMQAATPLTQKEMVAQAREYLGGDANLKAIKSLKYTATFKDHGSGNTGTLTIYLKKPMQQRIEVRQGDRTQVTAVDQFEGWRRVYSNSDPSKWEMVVMPPPEFKRLRANTWENLNFYTGLKRFRGRIEDKGRTTFDEKPAREMIFYYADDIYYQRFFDPETGELLGTINDQGLIIREEGDMFISGIRFPEKLITYADGKPTNTVTFEKIEVNPSIDDALFEFPVLR